jgi:ParB-like chromosome segregation protein Spo0J
MSQEADQGKPKGEIAVHPLADMFPPMNESELKALVKDIRENRLQQPIIMFEGKVLDGRNRYRACLQAGVEPTFDRYTGTEPAHYVISANLRRRNLTASQVAMIAVKFLPSLETEAKERQRQSKGRGQKGRARMPDLKTGKATEKASELFGCSPRHISEANRLKKASPELANRVEEGSLTIGQASGIFRSRNGATPKRRIALGRDGPNARQRRIQRFFDEGVKLSREASELVPTSGQDAFLDKHLDIYLDGPIYFEIEPLTAMIDLFSRIRARIEGRGSDADDSANATTAI